MQGAKHDRELKSSAVCSAAQCERCTAERAQFWHVIAENSDRGHQAQNEAADDGSASLARDSSRCCVPLAKEISYPNGRREPCRANKCLSESVSKEDLMTFRSRFV